MDLQSYLDNAVKAQRQRTLSSSDQLTLGKLIEKIEPIVAKQKERNERGSDEAEVIYDFCYLFPTDIDSWRGAYCELALNHNENGERMKVTAFLKMLKEAVGKEYTGYKGGEFTMSVNTPIWVANYGSAGSTAVVDVLDEGFLVILVTGYREY
jgi:hypothetical protein